MKSHASMNRIYRLVWNAALGIWVAVAENAKGRGKAGRAACALLAVLANLSPSAYAADAANARVVVGAGSIATSGTTTTINQVSQRLAVDWTQLSTAANEALRFNQPNAQAIALNRITGSTPSSFLGSLTANGQVFILNPNGVLFGAGSQVNVGGLVASTLAMSNADFQAGRNVFTNSSGTGSVVNKGTMTATQGGYLALLAPEVRNEGVMTASLGTALLAAGNKVTLNLDNGSLLGYSIDQGAINALAENKQLIRADGGQVLLSAKAMDALTTATVNNTGIIEARAIQNKAGRIMLMGDMEHGTVNVGGTLDASAPTGGNGGFIETSAAHVKVATGTKVTALAANGKTGKWLIDPNDFNVAASGGDITGATLSASLGNADVELQSFNGSTTLGIGDINVNDAVSWSANTLTLTAWRNVNINAVMTASGTSALALNPDANNIQGRVTQGVVKMGLNSSGFTGRVDFGSRSGNGFLSINGINYQVINALGAAGSTTGYDLQGMASGGNYALGSDIDASATAGWNGGAGFRPLNISSNGMAENRFNGLGHTINNLTIYRPNTRYVGLFGMLEGPYSASPTHTYVSNIGIVGGSVTGHSSVGALAGAAFTSIINSYSTASVSGNLTVRYASESVGGLVGSAGGITIDGSYATGNITGQLNVGGLVGDFTYGLISKSSASGNVTGDVVVGGLVGRYSSVAGTFGESYGVVRSHATGHVSGEALVGGLIGLTDTMGRDNFLAVYATGRVSGNTQIGGLIGSHNGGLLNGSYATGDVTGTGDRVGGLIGYVTHNDYPNNGIDTVYASGNVMGVNAVGGLIGAVGDAGAGLMGRAGYIFGAHASGTVTGSSYVGGLVGELHAADMRNSYSTGNVTGSNGVGGLVGYNTNSIDGSYATSNVTSISSGSSIGGLVGLNGDGSTSNVAISNSYSAGLVNGNSGSYTGGLVGTNNKGSISNSYSTSIVNGNNYVGGLVGQTNSGAITSSHATGRVTATGYLAGGLIGYNGNGNNTDGSDVSNSYATGNVTGTESVGGLIGASEASNITITNSYATGTVFGTEMNVGGLVGWNLSTISNSYAVGGVTGTNGVGGLLGYNKGAISNSYAAIGSVTGNGFVGGLVGFSFTGAISNSYATGNVNGGNATGGLVGSNGSGSISNSYATGNVTGSGAGSGNNVGGLVGYTGFGSISNSYATGSVTGSGDNVGGLVGFSNDSTISNSYAKGSVTGGSSIVGGLLGFNDSNNTITDSFWNTDTTGQATSAGGTGKTTAEMMQASTFANWSIASAGGSTAVWRIYEGQTGPLLRSFLTARTLADTVLTYNGGTQTATAAGVLGLGANGRNAGTYSNSGFYSAQDGFDLSGGGLVINKATVTVAGAVAVNKTYNGSDAATLSNIGTLSGLVSGEALTLSQTAATFADKNAGTGKVVTATGYGIANGTGGLASNYQLASTTATTSANIGKATVTVAGAVAVNKTYNGTDLATLSNIGTLSGLVSGEALTLSQTAATFADKNAGTGKLVTATGYGIANGTGGLASNYQLASTTATTSANIGKAALTLAAVTDSKTYDGSAASTATVVKTGLASGDSVTSLSQSFGSKNALGTGGSTLAVDTGYVVADGNSGGNYNVTLATAAGTINKAAITVTGAVAVNKTYNGTDAATLSNIGTLSGLANGEALTLSQTAATFADKNAGTSKVVTATGYGIANGTGGLASNYQLVSTSTTTSANIGKAALTVTANTVTRTYDGTAGAAGNGTVGPLAGFAAGEVVNTAGTQSFLDKNFGTANKTVRASGVSIKDSGNTDVTGNYTITYADNTISTINKAVLNISATPENKVYDGTTMATASYIDNRIGGDVLTYSATSSFADKNVANGIVVTVGGITTSGLDAGNYTVGSSTVVGNTANITPAALTITANNDSRLAGPAYSGGNGVVYSGLVGGETASVLTGALAYSGSSQGASAAGNYYSITPGGQASSNYTIAFNHGVLTLTPAPVPEPIAGVSAIADALLKLTPVIAGFDPVESFSAAKTAIPSSFVVDGGSGGSGGGSGGVGGGAGGTNTPEGKLNAAASDE